MHVSLRFASNSVLNRKYCKSRLIPIVEGKLRYSELHNNKYSKLDLQLKGPWLPWGEDLSPPTVLYFDCEHLPVCFGWKFSGSADTIMKSNRTKLLQISFYKFLSERKKKKDQINLIKQHIFIAMSWQHLRKWNFYITFNISINNIYLGIASKYFSCSQNESHYLVSKYRTEVHLCSHTGILC